MDHPDQTCVERLKSLREATNWNNTKERYQFLRRLENLIHGWNGRLPNFRNIFRTEEIDWLLMESTEQVVIHKRKELLIDFVIRTGYKDEPKIDENGKTLLQRTTAVHYMRRFFNCESIISKLFKIYDRFDVNFADYDGFTHFHVACMLGFADVVEKFLELGQDPNCLESKSVDQPLHLAVQHKHKKVIELLLTHNADPNLANVAGSTPLHIICKHDNDSATSLKLFFELSDEKKLTIQKDAVDNRGRTPLHCALDEGRKEVAILLLRRGANPNLADAYGTTPLHLICNYCKQSLYEDYKKLISLLKIFFEVCDEKLKIIQIDAVDKWGRTPLHRALLCYQTRDDLVELLLRRGANPNLADENGLTCLHLICEKNHNDSVAFLKTFFEISDERRQTIQIDAVDKSGWTPLHYALNKGHNKALELLLRRGANPNLADEQGETSLHLICRRSDDESAMLLQLFFEIRDEKQQPIQMDAVDKSGRTPLHRALRCYPMRHDQVELLLRRGANPNLADEHGETPLHLISRINHYDSVALLEILFDISDEKHQTIKIDAKDKSGRTPLHYALDTGHKKAAELLLRRGADPNLADAYGMTPLHLICQKNNDDPATLLKFLFEVSDEKQQTIKIDAVDKQGLTPLQWAVTSCVSGKVDVLLDHGADLSSFVFLTDRDFDQYITLLRSQLGSTPLKLVFNILTIVEGLKKRGYELDRNEALTFAKIFAEFGLLDNSMDIKTYSRSSYFLVKGKKLMLNSNLSLYDLTRLRSKEAEKLFTVTDFLSFVKSNAMKGFFGQEIVSSCNTFLCNIMARRFLRPWLLEYFMILTGYQLPILCCEKIMEKLEIDDLWRICLAAPC